jgi:hypothetical protein
MSNRKVSGALVAFSLLVLAIIAIFLSMVFVKINTPKSDCSEAIESVRHIDSIMMKGLQDSVQYLRAHPVHDTVRIPRDTTKVFNHPII